MLIALDRVDVRPAWPTVFVGSGAANQANPASGGFFGLGFGFITDDDA